MSKGTRMYHRFVQNLDRAYPNNYGIFSLAIDLWKRDYKDEIAGLNETMKWFNHFLEAPCHRTFNYYGIFWFKDGSDRIAKAIELSQILIGEGHKISHYTCEAPGEIVYDDKHQVAAMYNRRVKVELAEL